MPLYEYKCTDCGRPFELLVGSPSLADSVVCRHCGSGSVRRLVSTFAARSGSDSSIAAMERITAKGGGGGCCGGSCGCGH